MTIDNLSDQQMSGDREFHYYAEKDVKQHIQNAQGRLKEGVSKISLKTASGRNRLPSIVLVETEEIIDKIFKEEFGAKLL